MKLNEISSLSLYTIIAVLTVKISTAQNQQYCDLPSCSGLPNIACGNTGAFSKNCSSNAVLQPIDAAMQSAIVDKHNSYRNVIAGGGFGFNSAGRMATIRWKDELAAMAALNVKQCILRHDQCRNTPTLNLVGQNLYSLSWYGTTKTVRSVIVRGIEAWFKEYKYASMAKLAKYTRSTDGTVIGHFAQLIQEKATQVGCAAVTQTENLWQKQFVACNYDHANVLDYPVYTVSMRAASLCSTKPNPLYPNLCSPDEVYDVNAP